MRIAIPRSFLILREVQPKGVSKPIKISKKIRECSLVIEKQLIKFCKKMHLNHILT